MKKSKERLQKQLEDTKLQIKKLQDREARYTDELEKINQKEFFSLLKENKISLNEATEILSEKLVENAEKNIEKTDTNTGTNVNNSQKGNVTNENQNTQESD
jgi:hypothetical protein